MSHKEQGMTKNRGITLVESMIAIVLLGIVITAMVYSFGSARMYAASARHRIQAINNARDKVEKIIQAGVIEGYASPGDGVTYSPSPAPDPAAGTVDVTVTVSWTEIMWSNITQFESLIVTLNTIDSGT